MPYTIVYRRAKKFMDRVLAEVPLGTVVTWFELRKLMIKHGLASDKLTIKAYRERLAIFGFVKELGRSGKYQLRHPDIEHIVSLDQIDEKQALKKVVTT